MNNLRKLHSDNMIMVHDEYVSGVDDITLSDSVNDYIDVLDIHGNSIQDDNYRIGVKSGESMLSIEDAKEHTIGNIKIEGKSTQENYHVNTLRGNAVSITDARDDTKLGDIRIEGKCVQEPSYRVGVKNGVDSITITDAKDSVFGNIEVKGNSKQENYHVGKASNTGVVVITDADDKNIGKIDAYGNSTQKSSDVGKNICPSDFDEWESGTYNYSSGDKEDATNRIRIGRLIDVEPDTNYYFNSYTVIDNIFYPFLIREYDLNGEFICDLGTLYNNGTTKTTNNTKYLGIAIYCPTLNSSITFDDYKKLFADGTIKPFICLDSEVDKTYEPYIPNTPSTTYPSEIKSIGDSGSVDLVVCGKNLINNNQEFDDSIYAHQMCKPFVESFKKLPIGRELCYNCKRSGTKQEPGLSIGTMLLTTYNYTPIKQILPGEKFVLNKNVIEKTIRILVYGSSTGATISEIQIELGDVSTLFEPYKEQRLIIPCPKPFSGLTYANDLLKKENDLWGFERRMLPMILDGSETYNVGSASYNKVYCTDRYINIASIRGSILVDGWALCNMYKKIGESNTSNVSWYSEDQGFDVNGTQLRINFSNYDTGILQDDTSSVRTNKIKEYVKKLYDEGNPIEVLLTLKEDSYYFEPFDADTSATIDAFMKSVKTYSGCTNIYLEDSIGGIIKAEYYKTVDSTPSDTDIITPTPDYPTDIESFGTYNKDTMKYEFSLNVVGKNLFDVTKYNKWDSSWVNDHYRRKPLHLKPDTTYTISMRLINREWSSKDYVRFQIRHYKTDKPFQTGYVLFSINGNGGNTSPTILPYTFKTPDDGIVYLYVYTNETSLWFTDIAENIQIEEGEVATSYEPYVESQSTTLSLSKPLRGFSDVHDSICKRNNLYGALRRIDEYLFTGTETWGNQNKSETMYVCSYNMSVNGFKNNINKNYLNNIFKTNIENKENYMTYVFSVNKSVFGAEGIDDYGTLMSKWKSYLAKRYSDGNPMIQISELKEENYVFEPFQQETQDAINKLVAYSNHTNIYLSDANMSTILEIEYFKTDDTIEEETDIVAPEYNYPLEISGVGKFSEEDNKYHTDVVITGKNLFDKSNYQIGKIDSNTGEYIYQEPNTNGSNTLLCWDFIKVKPSCDYILKTYININYAGGFPWWVIDLYDKQKKYIRRYDKPTQPYEIKNFITDSDTYYIRIYANFIAMNSFTNGYTFQLEEGTIATSYEEYQGNIIPISFNAPLYGIDTIHDYIGKLVCNDYYVTNKLLKYVLEYDSSWVKSETNTYGYSSFFRNLDAVGIRLSNNTICNRFKLSTVPLASCDYPCFTITLSANNLGIRLHKTVCNNIDEFKVWLQNHETYIIAEKSAPTTEPLIDTENDLLINTKLHSGLNHVYLTDANHENIEIEYITDGSNDLTNDIIAPTPKYPSEICSVGSDGTVDLIVYNENYLNENMLEDIGFTNTGNGYYVKLSNMVGNRVIFRNTELIENLWIKWDVLYNLNGLSAIGLTLSINYTDGSKDQRPFSTENVKLVETWQHIEFKSLDGKIVDYIAFTYGSGYVSATIKNFIISDKDIEYTPHKRQSLTLPCQTPLLGARNMNTPDVLYKKNGLYGWLRRRICIELNGTERFVDGDSIVYNRDNTTDRYISIPDITGLPYEINNTDTFMNCFEHVPMCWETNKVGYCINKTNLHVNFNNKVVGISQTDISHIRTTKIKEYVKNMYDKGTPIRAYMMLSPQYYTFEPFTQELSDKIESLITYQNQTNILIEDGSDMKIPITVEYFKEYDAAIEETDIIAPSISYSSTIKSLKDFDIVSSGRNLLDISKYNKLDDTWSTGAYHTKLLQLKPDTTYYMSMRRIDREWIPGDYVIFNMEGLAGGDGNGAYMQINGTTLNYFYGKGKFKTNSTGKVYLRCYSANSRWFTDIVDNIQIEEGKLLTSYERYRGNDITLNYELRQLKDESIIAEDIKTINRYEKQAYIERNVGVEVFDGSQVWYKSSLVVNGYVGFYTILSEKIVHEANIKVLCDRLKQHDISDIDNLVPDEMIAVRDNGTIEVRFKYDTLYSYEASDFQSWLTVNNLVIQYPKLVTEMEPIEWDDKFLLKTNQYTTKMSIMNTEMKNIAMDVRFKKLGLQEIGQLDTTELRNFVLTQPDEVTYDTDKWFTDENGEVLLNEENLILENNE